MKVNGERLREIIAKKGMTATSLAEKMGVSITSVQRWKDSKTISHEMLFKLSDALNVNPEEIREEYRKNNNASNGNVSRPGRGNILHIPMSAEAGFIGGHLKQVFKEDTEQWMLPGYKAPAYSFEVSGDSMEETLSPGELVITTQQDSAYDDIAEGYVYVIATDDNILIKRAYKEGKGKLRLSSDNERYSDIVVSMEEVERLLVAKRYVSYRLNKRMKHVPKKD